MSLNIISETNIEQLSNKLIGLIKEEEKEAKKDMKMYLNKTNLSAEQKLKEYSSFSTGLFNAKISACLQTAQQYIIQDAQLTQQKEVNTSQINLNNVQKDIAVQEKLVAEKKVILTQKQIEQTEAETNATKTKTYLAIIETEVKIDNMVASTLTEVRKNGAEVQSLAREYTDPNTGQKINYQHLSLTACESTDQTKGLIGLQMLQLQKQGDTFNDHTKVQIANQIMQLGSTAIAEGLTSIDGILLSHKAICENLVGENIIDTNYKTIG